MTTNSHNDGFYAFHANHLEDLRDIVVQICKTAPLPPLTKDLFLVQSNGIAQWLKLALAADLNPNPNQGQNQNNVSSGTGLGIAAGIDTSLPSSFIWQAYRAILSPNKVPETSPLDKVNLAWRLYRLLPTLNTHPESALFTPLMQFMQQNNPQLRRFQLAQRLADLYDQYQVYRADWLGLWQKGEYKIIKANGIELTLGEHQRWQVRLWQILLTDIGSDLANTSRASVHQLFLEECQRISQPANPQLLPKRIFVFGVTSLPKQMLEALHAISRFTQVVFCVVNPCQYYWGDIVSDRELFAGQQRRGMRSQKFAEFDIEELHQHANPLLASLGKQGRDYIRLLDSFDETTQAQAAKISNSQQIDIYRDYAANTGKNESGGSCSLLQQIQNDILHLIPINEVLDEKRVLTCKAHYSLVFHQVHSAQREAEVLHDQLLAAFDRDKNLQPSDIIVMMPDVNIYAPYIRAVFSLYDKNDPRYIPFTISDQGLRQQEPMVIAFEQLLDINASRFTYSDVVGLLELSAISERFGIKQSDLSLLKTWIAGVNIRWGLSSQQRADVLSRDDIGGNTWLEGLESLLLGYSIGDEQSWQGIQSFPEVGGLQASLIGQLIDFVRALSMLSSNIKGEHNIKQWQQIVLGMLSDFFVDDDDKINMLKTDIIKQIDAIYKEFESGEALEETFDISIMRESLLSRLDNSTINHRFMIGKVNFATLMPMRAIPFKQVYLLGMNSGDYPRTSSNVDFDLMAMDYRPGDRSVREDDRYLFLEAMLSARELLYISWIGRSIIDDSHQPPSILIAQVQDYINKFYCTHMSVNNTDKKILPIDLLSTQHPLQAFSPQYFPTDTEHNQQSEFAKMQTNKLFTYAKEWRDAVSTKNDDPTDVNTSIDYIYPAHPLTLKDVINFLKSPVSVFYKQALGVRFDELKNQQTDTETFNLDASQQSMLIRELVNEVILPSSTHTTMQSQLSTQLNRLVNRGTLGIANTPSLMVERLNTSIEHISELYFPLLAQFPMDYQHNVSVNFEFQQDQAALLLQDYITGLRQNSHKQLANIVIATSRTVFKTELIFDAYLPHWLTHIAGNAAAVSFDTYVIAKDSEQIMRFPALSKTIASNKLNKIMAMYQQALCRTLPIEAKTAFVHLADAHLVKKTEIEKGSAQSRNTRKINECYKRAFTYDKGYLQKAFGNSLDFIHSDEFAELAEVLYQDLFTILQSQLEDKSQGSHLRVVK